MSPRPSQVFAGLLCAASCVAADAREPSFGDLVMGFTAMPSMGAPIAVEIDVGQASYYMAAAPGTYSVANLAADFSQAFGLWQSQRTISFGAVGTADGVVWATSAEPIGSSPGTPAPAYLGDGMNADAAAGNAIDALYGTTHAIGAFGGAETRTLANIVSQPNPLTSNAADSLIGLLSLGAFDGSYNAELATGGEGFAIPDTSGVQLAAVANVGFQSASADLYELLPSTPLGEPDPRFGYFTLNNSGLLTYTVVPEPAAAALVMAAGAIVAVSIRRRTAAGACI